MNLLALALFLAAPVSARPAVPKAAPAKAAPAPAPPAAPAPPGSSSVPGLAPLAGVPALLGLGVPPISPELAGLVQRWGNSRDARLHDVTTDGSQVLIGTRFGATAQLHLVEQPLGVRTQLTFGDEPATSARFLPQDPGVVFFFEDAGGGEFYQLHKLDRRTQKIELLTDGKSRNESLVISREGRRLAWSSTARNGKDTDVVVAETATPLQQRLLTSLEGTWRPLDFSPGGRQLLVVQERSEQDADLWLLEVETGEKKRLTPEKPKASLRAALFSSDGRAVFAITDRWGEVNELVRIDPANPAAAPRRLTASVPWEVERLAAAHDTGAPAQLAISINQEGYDRLYLVEPGTGALQPIALPPGILGGLRFPTARSDLLFFTIESARSPPDVWMLDVRTRRTTRWTRSELGPIDASQLVDPVLVRYPSPGAGAAQVQVPAFLYAPRPPESGEPRKLPVVVIWHGGPEGQARPQFNPVVQLLVSEGLAVLTPNVRGSSGYGKAWLAADDGVKREEALKDIGATLDWIGAQPGLDAGRVAIEGGSYGGYLTLACAAFWPERIKAAIDIVGISSLPTFLNNTQSYRRDLRRAEYGDERDPEVRKVLERISPLGSADRIRAALFVLQGKNDPRVPQSEAEQIVQAVRGRGQPVWYVLGLNEGHGFKRKENRDAQLALMLAFLREQLGGPR